MIELIFVIVILGILAAVAVPKLNATRADAEKAKATANISTLMSDFYTYHTSQGQLADLIQTMTNVGLKNGNLQVNGQDCLAVAKVPNSDNITFTKNTANTLCTEVLAFDSIKALLTGNLDCTKNTDDDSGNKVHSTAQTDAGCATGDSSVVVKDITQATNVTINFRGNGISW